MCSAAVHDLERGKHLFHELRCLLRRDRLVDVRGQDERDLGFDTWLQQSGRIDRAVTRDVEVVEQDTEIGLIDP